MLCISFSVSSTSPLAVDAVTQLRCDIFLDKYSPSELRKDKNAAWLRLPSNAFFFTSHFLGGMWPAWIRVFLLSPPLEWGDKLIPKKLLWPITTEAKTYECNETIRINVNYMWFMAFHPHQNSMLHFTFYFSHFILNLLFDIRVYTFVIQLSSCNIQVFALYIHLFVRDIQVHVQVHRVALSSFRIQCWAFANQVFAFNIWLYVFHLQVCIVHSTFQIVLFIRWSSTKDNRWAQLTQPTPANITMERLLTGVGSELNDESVNSDVK